MGVSLALARRQSGWLLPLLVIAAATALLVALVGAVKPADAGVDTSGAPSGDGIQPVVQDGNPTCGELAPGTTEFKVQPVVDGTFTQGPLTVTIDVRDTPDGPVFDWTSNIGINAIFVKGGDNGNLYVYDPADTADTSLHAPVNPSGKFAGLSHISFCFGADVPPTTAPPTTAPPTTAPPTTAPPVTSAAPPPPPGPAPAPGPAVAVTARAQFTG
jgi:hypothetical protein